MMTEFYTFFTNLMDKMFGEPRIEELPRRRKMDLKFLEHGNVELEAIQEEEMSKKNTPPVKCMNQQQLEDVKNNITLCELMIEKFSGKSQALKKINEIKARYEEIKKETENSIRMWQGICDFYPVFRVRIGVLNSDAKGYKENLTKLNADLKKITSFPAELIVAFEDEFKNKSFTEKLQIDITRVFKKFKSYGLKKDQIAFIEQSKQELNALQETSLSEITGQFSALYADWTGDLKRFFEGTEGISLSGQKLGTRQRFLDQKDKTDAKYKFLQMTDTNLFTKNHQSSKEGEPQTYEEDIAVIEKAKEIIKISDEINKTDKERSSLYHETKIMGEEFYRQNLYLNLTAERGIPGEVRPDDPRLQERNLRIQRHSNDSESLKLFEEIYQNIDLYDDKKLSDFPYICFRYIEASQCYLRSIDKNEDNSGEESDSSKKLLNELTDLHQKLNEESLENIEMDTVIEELIQLFHDKYGSPSFLSNLTHDLRKKDDWSPSLLKNIIEHFHKKICQGKPSKTVEAIQSMEIYELKKKPTSNTLNPKLMTLNSDLKAERVELINESCSEDSLKKLSEEQREILVNKIKSIVGKNNPKDTPPVIENIFKNRLTFEAYKYEYFDFCRIKKEPCLEEIDQLIRENPSESLDDLRPRIQNILDSAPKIPELSTASFFKPSSAERAGTAAAPAPAPGR